MIDKLRKVLKNDNILLIVFLCSDEANMQILTMEVLLL